MRLLVEYPNKNYPRKMFNTINNVDYHEMITTEKLFSIAYVIRKTYGFLSQKLSFVMVPEIPLLVCTGLLESIVLHRIILKLSI